MRDKDGQYSAMFSVRQFPSRDALGAASCDDVATTVAELLKGKETISMIFAAAPVTDGFPDPVPAGSQGRLYQDSRLPHG